MKSSIILFLASVSILSCKSTVQKEVVVMERPGQTELTNTKQVKLRNGKQNRERVKYYNSLQFKNNYRPQN